MSDQPYQLRPVLHFRIALLLAATGVVAVLLLMPYLFSVMPQLAVRTSLSLPVFAAIQSLQEGVLLLMLGWAGLRLGYANHLDAPLLRRWLRAGPENPLSSHWTVSIALGLAVGMVVLLLLHAFAALSSDTGLTAYNGPVWWKGLLASFYGGFVEEVQCRLFLVSLLVWLGARTRSTSVPGTGIYWIAIVLAAVIFGIGHLPILAQTTVLTTGSVLSTIGLNALCGVVFGWLFWRHGLEHSMLAHFSTDLVLHVVAPAFG